MILHNSVYPLADGRVMTVRISVDDPTPAEPEYVPERIPDDAYIYPPRRPRKWWHR